MWFQSIAPGSAVILIPMAAIDVASQPMQASPRPVPGETSGKLCEHRTGKNPLAVGYCENYWISRYIQSSIKVRNDQPNRSK